MHARQQSGADGGDHPAEPHQRERSAPGLGRTGQFLTGLVGELALGIERIAKGRRRTEFERWLEALIAEDFVGRILAFDAAAAVISGKLVADAMAHGRQPTVGDAQIAAVARRDGMTVATRDVADFRRLAVTVVDPWRGA